MIKVLFVLIIAFVPVCHAQTYPADVTFGFGDNQVSCGKGELGFATALAAANAVADRMMSCYGGGNPRKVEFIETPITGGVFVAMIEACENFQRGQCFDQFGKPGGSWYYGKRSILISAWPTCSNSAFEPIIQGDAWVCSLTARCPVSGSMATLARLTTIKAITETGYIVPDGSMPNPQCTNKCRVQHPGGQLQCVGYYPLNGLIVGGPVHVSCSADVTYTGTPCNYGGLAGIETLPESVKRPASYTQVEGNDDGGGGDGGADSEILALIRDNTGKAASTLQKVAENQVKSEENAEGRNTSLLDKLDELLGKLTSIDTKTGGGGGGGGNSGENGTGTTTGGESVGQVNLDIDAPSGGLKSPGETNAGFQKLLSGTGITRAAGTCPTWTFDIKFLNVAPVMDTHCALWSQNAAVFESLMLALWTLGALFLVLSA
jgi:hypothetical protein